MSPLHRAPSRTLPHLLWRAETCLDVMALVQLARCDRGPKQGEGPGQGVEPARHPNCSGDTGKTGEQLVQ